MTPITTHHSILNSATFICIFYLTPNTRINTSLMVSQQFYKTFFHLQWYFFIITLLSLVIPYYKKTQRVQNATAIR